MFFCVSLMHNIVIFIHQTLEKLDTSKPDVWIFEMSRNKSATSYICTHHLIMGARFTKSFA